jgi:hypothetical protein
MVLAGRALMRENLSKRTQILLLLALIISLIPASDAQDVGNTIADLKNLAAPEWVKEGTRMSYYSATAEIPEAYEKFILDEEGDWVGKNSGKRYRREEIFGAAGHGVTQVDVLSVDQGISALKVNSWLYSSFTGPMVPIKQAPSIGFAAGGDWYINPKALANLQDRLGEGLTILKMPYTLNGVTYDAIRIQQQSDTSTFAHIYDLKDGKLLATFNSAMSADKKSTIFAYATLIGVRQMDLPWLGQELPDWARQGSVLRYDGTKTVEAILARYSFPTNIAMEMEITDASPKFYTYTQSSSISASGFPSQFGQESLIGGIGEPSGLALPPDALAALQTGQIIDSDDVTGITVAVMDISQDDDGNGLVVIQSANEGYSADMTYDASIGVLIGFNEFKKGDESNEYTDIKLTQME